MALRRFERRPIWCPRQDSNLRTRLRRPIWTVQTIFPVSRSAPELDFLSRPSVSVLPVTLS